MSIKTSTSLSAVKSARIAEPKSESSRRALALQKPAIASLETIGRSFMAALVFS
jgi:hypothetical protein